MQRIGDRLREARERIRVERGLSQFGGRPWVAEIEERTGYAISAPTASGYEAEDGTEKIPGDYLAAVCRTYGISPEWLLLGEGPMRRPSPEEAERFYRRVAEWLRGGGEGDAGES